MQTWPWSCLFKWKKKCKAYLFSGLGHYMEGCGFSCLLLPALVFYVKSDSFFYVNAGQDDSRRIASTLFPSLSPLLERKKDHGRCLLKYIAISWIPPTSPRCSFSCLLCAKTTKWSLLKKLPFISLAYPHAVTSIILLVKEASITTIREKWHFFFWTCARSPLHN